jgi:nucleotide-binding universal stress UspA family protein
MNTIIVLSDLVDDSDPCFSYAVELARKIGAPIVLLHFYVLPVSMPDTAFPVIVYEDLHEGVKDRLSKRKEELQAAFPGVSIDAESALGEVAGNIKETLKNYPSPIVVMGNRGEKSNALFGSTTTAVIRNADFPVLVVPDAYTGFRFSKLVFASDLDVAQTPVTTIKNVVQQLGMQLHVVHVYSGSEEPRSADGLLQELSSLQPLYSSIRDEEVDHGIQQFLSERDADMLMIAPHEHSLLERFFLKLHTSEIVHHSPIPVLCISR